MKPARLENSIDVDSSVDVQPGGSLELISPRIQLLPGFGIPSGGELSIISDDPGVSGP